MYSAYELDPSYGWLAVHRLKLNSAIEFCMAFRRQKNCLVAVVPDGEEPGHYLSIVEDQELTRQSLA